MINSMPRIAIAVNDFDETMHTFADSFGMPVVDLSEMTATDLGARVGLCIPSEGSNIEIMAPTNPELPLAQSLQRFLDRRGEGLYALMLEAPDPNAEAEELTERGLDVLPLMPGAGGRDVHPRSTHGVLIRVYPDNSVGDQGPQQSAEPGLSGIAKVIIATDDAEKAADVYRRGFGLDVGAVAVDAERGLHVALGRAPAGGDIELVSVADATRPFAERIERFLTERGQGMFALVLKASDPATAASVMERNGVSFQTPAGIGHIETKQFGTTIIID